MSALIQTLFDIMRLRKGPDAIPRSQVVLIAALGMWFFAELVSIVGNADMPMERRSIGILVSVVALVIYALIVQFYGHRERLLQMLSAMIGCGAVLLVILTMVLAIGDLMGDENPLKLFFAFAALAVLPWSVLIDGHILSRTINQPRIVGVMIAMSIFLLQLYLLEIAFSAPDIPVAGE